MSTLQRIVIVGGTSAIALQCARAWLADGAASIVLLGRDAQGLARAAADLAVRSPASQIETAITDFHDPVAIAAVVNELFAKGPVDLVLVAHGVLPDQQACQQDLARCRQALEINAVSPVLYAEAFARGMAAANRGTLALFASVAGDRGRKSNYVYGAAKGLIARYAQGLQHRFAGSGVRVVLVKPGPTETPMTSHLKATGVGLASAEAVGQRIASAISAGKPVVYAPARWAYIMMLIRHLPATLFNRLDI